MTQTKTGGTARVADYISAVAAPRGQLAAVRPLVVAVAVISVVAVWFTAGWGGRTLIQYADDLGCGAAALIGARAAWQVSRAGPAAYRRAWALLAAGALSWALGEAAWTVVDLLTGSAVDNPVISDIAFVPLPLFAAAAILQLPSDGHRRVRVRGLLDGAIVALSACFVLWDLVVQRLAHGHLTGVGLMTNGTFPLADVALLTAVVLAASYASTGQARLWVLAAALTMLAVGDSGFAYLRATGTYRPGAFCDIAYIAAFCILTAAAYLPHGLPAPMRPASAWSPKLRLALPYLPLVATAAVVVQRLATGERSGGTAVVLLACVAALVIARQYLAMLDNERLVCDLEQQRERLHAFTLTDPLTGVANRVMFADRVRHALQLHARDGRSVAVCWVDLDDFKLINDTFGHGVGDHVLTELAGRMAATLRAGDTLARVGGDEFAVLLEDGGEPATVGEKLIRCGDDPISVAGQPIRVGLSVGLAALAPGDAPIAADELMSRADIAMYAAKGSPAPHLVTYESGMIVPGAEDASLREPLKDALADGDIAVHYQPIMTADTCALHGFEALARWTLDGVDVPPARFVPLAERLGIGRELGDQVLAAAIAQAGEWSRRRGDHNLVMSINLSPAQLADPDLPVTVARLMQVSGVQPRQVMLEITEGALLTDTPHAVATARALSKLGVSLALDDFGTGYSSLARLRGFPLTGLKIDHSFIADIDTDAKAHVFLSAVARLAHDLGLEIIAEGVERPGQLRAVQRFGPALAQGYLFSRALPAHEFDDLVMCGSAADRAGGGREGVVGLPRAPHQSRVAP